jgi:hypothetical protein
MCLISLDCCQVFILRSDGNINPNPSDDSILGRQKNNTLAHQRLWLTHRLGIQKFRSDIACNLQVNQGHFSQERAEQNDRYGSLFLIPRRSSRRSSFKVYQYQQALQSALNIWVAWKLISPPIVNVSFGHKVVVIDGKVLTPELQKSTRTLWRLYPPCYTKFRQLIRPLLNLRSFQPCRQTHSYDVRIPAPFTSSRMKSSPINP